MSHLPYDQAAIARAKIVKFIVTYNKSRNQNTYPNHYTSSQIGKVSTFGKISTNYGLSNLYKPQGHEA